MFKSDFKPDKNNFYHFEINPNPTLNLIPFCPPNLELFTNNPTLCQNSKNNNNNKTS